MSTKYWREALLAALEDAAPHIELTETEVDEMADVLAGAAETRAEVTGEIEQHRASTVAPETERQRLDRVIAIGRDYGERGLPIDNVNVPVFDAGTLEYVGLRYGHHLGLVARRAGRGNYEPFRSALS